MQNNPLGRIDPTGMLDDSPEDKKKKQESTWNKLKDISEVAVKGVELIKKKATNVFNTAHKEIENLKNQSTSMVGEAIDIALTEGPDFLSHTSQIVSDGGLMLGGIFAIEDPPLGVTTVVASQKVAGVMDFGAGALALANALNNPTSNNVQKFWDKSTQAVVNPMLGKLAGETMIYLGKNLIPLAKSLAGGF